MNVEHTLAVIKPEGMASEQKIMARLKKEGFMILSRRMLHLTPEQVSDFYQDRYGQIDFPLLVASTSASPVIVLCLGRTNAVEKLKEVVGPYNVLSAKSDFPNSLNAQFGNVDCNLAAVHASEDVDSARREIHFFFPQSIPDPLALMDEDLQYLDREVLPLLKEGLAQMLKVKPAEPMLWLAGWLLKHNPNKPITQEHLRHEQFHVGSKL